jgi:hypothetical protein
MNARLGYCITASLVLLAACGSSKDKAAAGGSSGAAGSSLSGDSGSSGDSGAGTNGDSSPSAGDSGSAGDSSSTGGASGSGGSSSTAGGSPPNGGGSGKGGEGGVENRGYLLGPVMDDQTPLVVTVSHQLSPFCYTTDKTTLRATCDAAGNIFIQCKAGNLLKFDAHFAPGWSISPSTANKNLAVSSVAIFPSGGIVVGGGTAGGAAVARYDENGTQLWQTAWSSSGGSLTTAVAVASDRSIYATGLAYGQAPGNPPTASGGKWIAHYDVDGNMLWLKQYGGDQVNAGLFLGATGDLYLAKDFTFEKLDADGNISLKVDNSGLALLKDSNGGTALAFPDYGLVGPAGDSFYTMASWGAISGVLINMSLSGLPNWFRVAEPARTAVIDPVEGTTWTGTLGSATTVLANGEAIYIVGQYSNQYMLGSKPPPMRLPIFVGRYDLNGNRVWFQEYLPLGNGQLFDLFDSGGSAFDPDGNLVVEADTQLNGTYLFRVRAQDGTILQ